MSVFEWSRLVWPEDLRSAWPGACDQVWLYRLGLLRPELC